MKALIADAMPDDAIAALRTASFDVVYKPGLKAEKLAEHVSDAEILVVRSTRVKESTFAAAPLLQLVVRAGAGVNTIDVTAASERGVYVANCPGKNAIAVAELTLGLALSLDRRIPWAHADLKAGRWHKKRYSKADGLCGKRWGVVGCGPVGRAVIKQVTSLGMPTTVWSRSLDEETAHILNVAWASSLETLAQSSDIVSIHLARTPETTRLIDATFLSRLPTNAMVINTSRDGIVDEQAVLHAMESRGLRYATDVYEGEPGSGDSDFHHPVAQHPDVVVTPHIGASTLQAQKAVAAEAIRIVKDFARWGIVENCVNLRRISPAPWVLTVRHHDHIGVLAAVLEHVRQAGINVQEVSNAIFEGASRAVARIYLASEPPPLVMDALREMPDIIDARILATQPPSDLAPSTGR